MNPVRHNIHILPVYAVLLLLMYLTSPPESIHGISKGLGGVVFSTKVRSAIGCSKNPESCCCGVSEDFIGIGSRRNVSWTKCVGTSLTWPIGLSTGLGISSLSGCGSRCGGKG